MEGISGTLKGLSPAQVLEDENIGVILAGSQSVSAIIKQLTRFYKSQGVAVKLPNIQDFIKSIAVSIASDPATNLIQYDINSIFRPGETGVDTTFWDVGGGRTIKTIHYNFKYNSKDTTIHRNYDF